MIFKKISGRISQIRNDNKEKDYKYFDTYCVRANGR